MHMSNQTGFDYEVMLSRLHGGLCAFQTLRAFRRHREQAAAPSQAPEERVAPEPPRAARVAHLDEQVELRAPGSLEPQAFVTMGGRVVPIFGDLGLLGAMAGTAAPTPSDPPAPPQAAPAPAVDEARPPQAAAAPASAASTLKLPPPTPPPRLGLIYGGRPPPPDPAPMTESSASPPTDDPPAAPRPQASPPTAVQAQEAPRLAPITALLDARAQEDAQRLERAHAAHRAAVAILLREHRDELRAQSEADATRTTALLREVFAEHRAELRAQSEADAARTTELLREVFTGHRAELAQANQAHADQVAQVLAQHPQNADPRGAAGDTGELRAALLEQATLQREANEDVADHIAALTTIVADLGQTVGMLAVAATHKAQQIRATFTPPPRVEPATTVASAASPHVEPATTVASAASPHVEPATTRPLVAASARVGPAASTSSDAAPAAANQPVSSLTRRITEEPAHQRPIRVALPQEAAERARLQKALEDDRDDDDLATGLASDDDDDDPTCRRRLPPITAIESPDENERDDV
jgi:hypothetical protein